VRTKSILLMALFVMSSTAPLSALGNSIADQVAALDDGRIWLSYESREGVRGDGHGSIKIGDSTWCRSNRHHWSSRDDDDYFYEEGPVRVYLRVHDGEVTRLKTYVGGEWDLRHQEVVNLGTVSPRLAAEFLLSLADNYDDEVAEDAVFAASLADAEVWPELLDLARDRRHDDEVRQSAIVWLSRFAGERVTDGLVKLVDDNDEELEVRETAIFALSQHSGRQAVPQLTRIALENPHPQLREQALFWLAQNDDPRVLELFEEILTGD